MSNEQQTSYKIAIGSDHHGIEVRKKLSKLLLEHGHTVTNYGPESPEPPVDYPDIASAVAERVGAGEVDRGILICGTGIGMCIAANKFPGVRAAPIIDEVSADVSRRHNDLNILCLSAEMLSEVMIEHLAEVWLKTPFDGGRHQKRLDAIKEIEQCGHKTITETD
ncbi:MAG: ribose 5-phosphate isomerase B [Planctomycetaceae bacterium]|jgi:ribose 5-phosphate isomerase B|nr:ribose 5-phosphate isomerase B [Planctomycetaceae bacterium]